mgnify:CR=1 FL=1
MRCVTYTGAGGNEVVACEERPDPICGDEEVLIHAAFAGINGADVSQRQGNYPAPPGWPSDIPGLEVAGVIQAVGSKVRQWKIGDRAYGLVGGGGGLRPLQGAGTGSVERSDRLGREERSRDKQKEETPDHGVVTLRPEITPCKAMSLP